jgi:Ca2+-transporting ATPase
LLLVSGGEFDTISISVFGDHASACFPVGAGQLEAAEAALTGESLPVARHAEPLVDRILWRRLLVMVTTSVAAIFGFFAWRLSTGAPFELVRSGTFTVLAVCQWFNVLNCQSELKSALNFSFLKNYWLLGGLVPGKLLQVLVIYTGPMNRIFHTVPIPLPEFFLIGAVASLVLWAEEIRKGFARRRAGREAGS